MGSVSARDRRIEARARPLSTALAGWLQRYGKTVVERELRRQIRKSDDSRSKTELAGIINLFGVRMINEAASGVAGQRVIVPSSAISSFLDSKTVAIQVIADETRDTIRNQIRAAIQEYLSEVPKPTDGEIARRIRSTYFGNPDDVPFVISSERAALIARTEISQAENTGDFIGYQATGVEEIEWLAYTDGKSGHRHHERMNGTRVKVGEMFTTPLGNELRYPGDPDAPIAETANCRCTTAPVRRAS